MEITIKGPGQVTICFIDGSGKTLLQERLRSGGSPNVGARRPVSLLLHTRRGHVEVAPVLVDRGEKQQVTFDGANRRLLHDSAVGISAAATRSLRRRRAAALSFCGSIRLGRPGKFLSVPDGTHLSFGHD